MGMSQEQWDAFVVAGDGVEIRQDGDYNAILVVDEHEVWTDGTSEPEDMCLSRDLASFVHAIKSLAAERTKLRLDLAEAIARAERAEAQLAALREAVERALLCGALRLVDTPEEVAAARALETATYDAGAAAEAHDREVEARALESAADAIEERGEATRHPSQIGPTAWNPSGTVLTDAGAARCDEARWLRARAAERRGR